MLDPDHGHQVFLASVRQVMPAENVLEGLFERVTHGADASPYSLVPKAVLLVETEEEIVHILSAANRTGVPVTFRAAGTSLSGQAVTNSVLVKLGHNGWRQFEAREAGQFVRVGPAMVGAHVNARLARHHRKIGPDPASIGAAMMGGIAANNSSGMCCGTEQNTYRTLRSMRIVFIDGTRLDTGDPESRIAFARTHVAFLEELSAIAREATGDAVLSAMIRRKYEIKNTTGYSLNALTDFTDPIDILQHLLIGSEGTLAFISEVTLETVPEPKLKSAALVLFPDMRSACAAATRLKLEPVSAVEMMDFASLASVIGKPGIPDSFATLPSGTSALLIDLRAETAEELDRYAISVEAALAHFAPLERALFSTDPVTYANYWNVRKGLLPSVGGMRPAGTTVIVEDVAVPIEHLADAAIALREIFDRLAYDDAIIFGHALDGNLHFVFPQSFNTPADIVRYALLTAEITQMIAVRFEGALKAEHGTGRAMAPFVELEWGAKAYGLMRRIKALFDPNGILNPGVVISDDPDIYLKALKALPTVDPLIDKCIECGFCEPVCPSRALTTTPRQRIVATRALAAGTLPDEASRHRYDYAAVDTCAGDGLCAGFCPVGIDTGEMMRTRRQLRRGPASRTAARTVEHHIGLAMSAVRGALGVADLGQRALGPGGMNRTIQLLRGISRGRIPQWTPYLPTPGRRPKTGTFATTTARPRIVLFSSCVSSVMGPARDAPDARPLWDVLKSLFDRAGYDAVLLTAVETACCGMPFQSKGFPQQAAESAATLAARLLEASRGGSDIVVSDTSPCSNQMALTFPQNIRPMDITAALARLVLPKLNIRRKAETIALHVTCSTRKMGQDALLLELARACADEVIVPDDIECCGFAGDKGFDTPELNASALRTLKGQLPERCNTGYSTSRTCEIGLSAHSDRHYQSIAYLLDWASTEAPAHAAIKRTTP
ncbi:D-lactate dehydrogenase (cytochrome) [Rhizobium sp. CF080]|uniref:FAD-binding and (Fe-S)-binding domain-containing protein n=1 Tax=Rhizobium sp. (strain CF080) TaxID=1144310 RepID=UPI0002718179|nr:FAD-binding and (Fe-S)-binding domain-containing protein [Rhizobium sp. CF080]EUC00014.1 D-lactate dehydrogenase (cytochrome) [Rhizobium sp. CF080]